MSVLKRQFIMIHQVFSWFQSFGKQSKTLKIPWFFFIFQGSTVSVMANELYCFSIYLPEGLSHSTCKMKIKDFSWTVLILPLWHLWCMYLTHWHEIINTYSQCFKGISLSLVLREIPQSLLDSSRSRLLKRERKS